MTESKISNMGKPNKEAKDRRTWHELVEDVYHTRVKGRRKEKTQPFHLWFLIQNINEYACMMSLNFKENLATK